MADFLDELISISKELGNLKNEVTDMGSRIIGEEPERTIFNPADYREEPRANPALCPRCIRPDEGQCSRCFDVCPVDAIRIEDGGIEILKDCRKCGLCVTVCPTQALNISRYSADALYRLISSTAAVNNQAYVTCTRALGHVPEDAQVVLPCVGLIPREVWAAVLLDYPNVSVYLPLGICDKCRTTTGESTLAEEIEYGETWSERSVGLEVDEDDLDLEKRRDVERRNFVKNMAKSAGLTASKINPVTARLGRAYEKLQAHQLRFDELGKTLDRLCGVSETKKERVLITTRQLLMTACKDHPECTERIILTVAALTERGHEYEDHQELCAEPLEKVAQACPVGALDCKSNQLSIETSYCVGCGLCADLAPELLELVQKRGEEALYRFKPEAEAARIAEQENKVKRAEERKEHISAIKTHASKAARVVERMSDSFEDE